MVKLTVGVVIFLITIWIDHLLDRFGKITPDDKSGKV